MKSGILKQSSSETRSTRGRTLSKLLPVGLLAAGSLMAAPAMASVTVVAEDFQKTEMPWDMAFLQDGTMFFTEKCKGLSVRLPNGKVNALLGVGGSTGYSTVKADLFCDGQAGVQGVAMGAAVMAARAIVRDLFQPHEGAHVMSQALSGLGIIACTCAPVGGLLSDWFGWRMALLAVTAFGLLTLTLLAWGYRESLPQPRHDALRWSSLWRANLEIIRHPAFRTWCALSSASYLGLFTFLAASSFIFIDVLHLTRTQYGLAMFSMSVAYISGTFLCRRLLPRLGMRRAVAVAGALSLAGGTAMGLLAWAGVRSPWALLVPFWVYMLGHGIHQPCGQTGAVAPFPRMAGAASALNGFMMMATAFLVGGWIGTHLDGTVTTLTHGVWFWSACLAGVAWTLIQRHGEPPKH